VRDLDGKMRIEYVPWPADCRLIIVEFIADLNLAIKDQALARAADARKE
jgi:hypothetical protein